MEDRISVRLPDGLRAALDTAARRERRRTSEIVRTALVAYLSAQGGRRRPAYRVRRLIGSLASGVPDLARRHREHVLKSLRRGG